MPAQLHNESLTLGKVSFLLKAQLRDDEISPPFTLSHHTPTMSARRRLSDEESDLLDAKEDTSLVKGAGPYPSIQVSRDGHHAPLYLEDEDDERTRPSLPNGRGHVSVHRRGMGFKQSRFSLNRRRFELDDEDGKKPRRSFCRSWCEMWFLLAQSRFTCIGLSALLFGGGLLLILLAVLGGLNDCPTLHGAVVFCVLMGLLSICLGFLCCFYHWVKDDDDLPFAIFCVAYCLLLLFMIVTIAGTVVVFTRIHPIGPDQPPPGIPLPNKNATSSSSSLLNKEEGAVGVASTSLPSPPGEGVTPPTNRTEAGKDCSMVELPLGVLVICYFLSLAFVIISYMACILALGATSDIPPL